MKIYKIQCDICGKIVDHNDKKKVNRLVLHGITNGKNIQQFIDKENNYENIIVNMEFDLCEDCLIELYKMINYKMVNKYMKE